MAGILTYPIYVLGVSIAMLFGPADPAPQQNDTAFTYGPAMQDWVKTNQEYMLTLTHRRANPIWGKFRPMYSVGISNQGTVFVSAALSRPLDIFGVKVIPHFGPTLYKDNHQNDLLQFRTGFDITHSINDTLSFTGGFYHISNGQANPNSADIDVAHFGLSMRF